MKAKGMLGAGKKPVIAYLNGGPTDNNSKLFKQGYAGVLDPLIKSGKAAKGPDQGVPAWDNQKARTIFEQMLVKTGNKIDAVAAANDGLANAVVTALKAKKLSPIPVSGQDATAQGAQNIISGWQSGTVYKPAKVEADGRPSSSQSRCSREAGRRRTARRTTACATCRRSSRRRSGSRRGTSTCSTPTGSSRSPRCASARTSSTARRHATRVGEPRERLPHLLTPGERA